MRIAGVQIPDKKHVLISLTYVYGIGKVTSQKILSELKIPTDRDVKDLSEAEQKSLIDHFATLQVEGDLRREIQMNIKRLQEIGSWRGYRHRKGLTVRGQTTKRNCRTRRGKKRTAIGGTNKKD